MADENGWFTYWISVEREMTQRKNEDIQKALLAETSQLFNQPMKLNLLLKKVLKKVVAYDHFAIAEIWLTGADISKISLVAKTTRNYTNDNFYKETSQFQSFVKGENLPGAVWESGKILVWNHLDNRSEFLRLNPSLKVDIKLACGIPLISEKTTLGVLIIGMANKKIEILESLMPLFEKLGTLFGVEIKRKQLEEELHQIFSLAPDIICILGTDRYLKKANPAMSTLLGYSETELLGQPLDNFLHPDNKFSDKLRMDKFIAGEKTLSFENRFLTKKGKTLWLSWTTHLNEREGLLFCVAKDITNRKLSESLLIDSEKRYIELFQLSPLPIIVFDLKNLRFLDVNKSAVNQYGYTKKEFLMMTIEDLRPAEDKSLTEEMMMDLKEKTGSKTHHAIMHQKKNGEKINVDIQSNPLIFGKKNARIAVINDITESLRYIHEIELQNEKFREISWMQSHVVRAPLARLMGLISIIDITEELPTETKKILDYVLQSAHELDEIIRNITLKTELSVTKKLSKITR